LGHIFIPQSTEHDNAAVLTSWVYALIGTANARARPKSASLMLPAASRRRFWGFRSRCKIRWQWQNIMPCN